MEVGIEFPGRAMKAYPAGHPAAMMILALAPDLLAGWTRAPMAAALPLLPPAVQGLPRVPRLPAGSMETALEAVRNSGAGLIVDVGGAVAPGLADIAAAAGVELLTLDGRLAATPEMLRRLGRVLGRADRGEMLAAAAARWLEQTAAAVGPAMRVHYGCGPDALEVPSIGALGREVFQHLGLETFRKASERPLARVSVEEVAAFDPDWIVCLDRDAADTVRADSAWRNVRAVAMGRILASPHVPFLWLDRPPGINRFLGLLWLAGRVGRAQPLEGEERKCLRLLCGWPA